MAHLDLAARALACRVVYCGAPGAGKTTNLEAIHLKLPAAERGPLQRVVVRGVEVAALDYLPADGGSSTGLRTRFRLEEAPPAPSPAFLAGADGLVFVADAQAARQEANLEALEALERAWRATGKGWAEVALVFQWNKQDLPDLAPAAELEVSLGSGSRAAFATSARQGQGVLATLRAVARQILLRCVGGEVEGEGAGRGTASGAPRAAPRPRPRAEAALAEPPSSGEGEDVFLGDLEPADSSDSHASDSHASDSHASGARTGPAAPGAPAPADPIIGRRFGGCVVRALLDQGGMGTIYLARDEARGDDVVVKLMRPDLTNPRRVERFFLEARASARVEHPNVVRVRAVGTSDDGLHYMIMALVPGEDLAKRVRARGPLDVAASVRVTLDVARALVALHDAGLVHRDIKPENVVVVDGPPVRATLIDFGLVKDLEADLHLTHQGARVGTPIYMAPEVGRPEPLDGRADIYSLGLSWYHALTGHRPFAGQGLFDVLCGRGRLPAPEALNPAVGPDVRRVLDRMCAGPREERYPDARALVADLEALLAGRPPAARPAAPDVPWSPVRRSVAWFQPRPGDDAGRLSVGGLSDDLFEVAERLVAEAEGARTSDEAGARTEDAGPSG